MKQVSWKKASDSVSQDDGSSGNDLFGLGNLAVFRSWKTTCGLVPAAISVSQFLNHMIRRGVTGWKW